MHRSHHSLLFSLLNAAAMVALLWLVWLLHLILSWPISQLGVAPGQFQGLVGIALAPVIHLTFEHLISNTVPLFILLSALLYGYPRSRWRVLAVTWIGSGLGVWLFARDAVHFGASGLTHGLFFFLLLASILRRDKRSIALMCIAFFLYGGMVISVLPRAPEISYEYHFFGAVFGVLSALLFRNADPLFEESPYEWEGDDGAIENSRDLIGDEWRLDRADMTDEDKED